jgi:hypothetical protein
VGERLALWALAKDYGKKDLVYSGPLYKEMRTEAGWIRIVFDSVGSGLTVATKAGREPIVADPRGKLQQFAIAGEVKKWVWADAVIDGEAVLVSSSKAGCGALCVFDEFGHGQPLQQGRSSRFAIPNRRLVTVSIPGNRTIV